MGAYQAQLQIMMAINMGMPLNEAANMGRGQGMGPMMVPGAPLVGCGGATPPGLPGCGGGGGGGRSSDGHDGTLQGAAEQFVRSNKLESGFLPKLTAHLEQCSNWEKELNVLKEEVTGVPPLLRSQVLLVKIGKVVPQKWTDYDDPEDMRQKRERDAGPNASARSAGPSGGLGPTRGRSRSREQKRDRSRKRRSRSRDRRRRSSSSS